MATTSVAEWCTPVLAAAGIATDDSASLVSGHRFPREIILLAVHYYLQLGAAAERIAGLLADRGIDVSGGRSCAGCRSSGLRCLRRSAGTGSQ